MNCVVPDAHAGKRAADPPTQGFVVIAGQIDYFGAVRRSPQQPVQDLVVLVRPEPALSQAPAVDDVTDQVQILRVHVVQKIEEAIGLAPSSAEVYVRNEDRTVATTRDATGGFH